MLYIVTALKAEAQAFIDKYKLQKSKLSHFSVYSNDVMMLIVSGVGVSNATHATQTFINHYDITDDDIYLNVGICGASKNYQIGEVLEIGAISYNTKTTKLPNNSEITITCVDEEVNEESYEVVDMESYGFYDALIHSPAIKNFHIIKVVSDHFEPDIITKENTKALIFKALETIQDYIKG